MHKKLWAAASLHSPLQDPDSWEVEIKQQGKTKEVKDVSCNISLWENSRVGS